MARGSWDLPSKISGSIADGDLARLCATIYVRVASGFENKKAPSWQLGGWWRIQVLVKGMTGAAKHVFEFVPDKVFNRLTGRAKIFARIKFLRIFREYLADAGGHGQAQIGVNVDLRATHAPRDFDVRFRHALGIGHLAAVFVDLGHEILRHAGSAMQHQRIITHAGVHERFLDQFQTVQIQVLFPLELESAMGVADGDGERVTAGFLDEFDSFFRVGIVAVSYTHLRAHETRHDLVCRLLLEKK